MRHVAVLILALALAGCADEPHKKQKQEVEAEVEENTYPCFEKGMDDASGAWKTGRPNLRFSRVPMPSRYDGSVECMMAYCDGYCQGEKIVWGYHEYCYEC